MKRLWLQLTILVALPTCAMAQIDFGPGSNDVNLGDDNVLDFGTGDFTVMAWVRTSANGDVFSTRSFGNTFWAITVGNVRTSDKAEFGMGDGGPTSWTAGTTVINDGQWHHIAGVADGGMQRIYVDGVQENSQPETLGSVSNSNPKVIGSYSGGGYFNGAVDDVRAYGVALSANEIAAIANTRIKGPATGVQRNVLRAFSFSKTVYDWAGGLTATKNGGDYISTILSQQ